MILTLLVGVLTMDTKRIQYRSFLLKKLLGLYWNIKDKKKNQKNSMVKQNGATRFGNYMN